MEYLMRSTEENNQEDFFETIKTIICYGHKFSIENPKMSILLSRVYLGNNDPFHGDGLNNLMKHGGEWVQNLVEDAKETGQVSKNYDTDIIVHVIYQTAIDMFKFVINKHNMSYDDILNIKHDEVKEDLNKVISEFMEFIKYGLKGLEKRN